MDREQLNQFLGSEYLELQSQYEDFDRRSLTIKGWISAGSIAAIAIGLDSQGDASSKIWPVIGAITICFWYLETKWRSFQYALRGRIKEIEAHFRNDKNAELNSPFQIYNSWFKYHGNEMSFWKIALQSFVMLPYSLILIACCVLMALENLN